MSIIGIFIVALVIGFICGSFLMGLIGGAGRNNQLEEAYLRGFEDANKAVRKEGGSENDVN